MAKRNDTRVGPALERAGKQERLLTVSIYPEARPHLPGLIAPTFAVAFCGGWDFGAAESMALRRSVPRPTEPVKHLRPGLC